MPRNAKVHNVRIVDRKITYPRNDRWVQNCVNGDVLRVSWDGEWDYMTDVVAIFVNAADGMRSKPIDITEGQCEIPASVLLTSGRLFVTIIGYMGEDQRLVTQKMERPFLINESGDVYDTLLPEITADVLQKILGAIPKIEEAVNNALALSREAQAIIDSVHGNGYTYDGLILAFDSIANRLTQTTQDIWLVSDILYASHDVATYDTAEGEEKTAVFSFATVDEEDTIEVARTGD